MSLLLSLLITLPLHDEGSPAPDVPELVALRPMAGTWDIQVTSTGVALTKGQVTTRWILDGRFLEQVGHLTNDDGSSTVKVNTILTWDRKKKKYRSWLFLSSGDSTEAEPVWDDKAKTMTTTIQDKDNTTTTVADFSTPGKEAWSITSKDVQGKVQFRIEAINTKRK